MNVILAGIFNCWWKSVLKFVTSKKIAPFTGSVIRHIWWRHTPTFNGFYCHSCHTYDASLFHGFGPSDGAFDENWRCRVFCLLSAPIRYLRNSQNGNFKIFVSRIFYVKSVYAILGAVNFVHLVNFSVKKVPKFINIKIQSL